MLQKDDFIQKQKKGTFENGPLGANSAKELEHFQEIDKLVKRIRELELVQKQKDAEITEIQKENSKKLLQFIKDSD